MVCIALCDYCKHYTEMIDGWKPACEAYPDGIKKDFYGSHKECANGIAFEMMDNPPAFAEKLCKTLGD